MTLRLCKYCEYQRVAYYDADLPHRYRCTAEGNDSGNISLVDGYPLLIEDNIYAVRYDEDKCGTAGKWYKENQHKAANYRDPSDTTSKSHGAPAINKPVKSRVINLEDLM